MADNEQMGLTTRPAQDMQVAAPQPTVLDMIGAVLKNNVTAESVLVVAELAKLRREEDVWNAAKAFARAFARLQSELPTIVASSVIPNRGKYERFEDVMRQIAPFLSKHGFSVSFSMDVSESRIVETCHLTHEDGHTRANSFAVRVSGKADSETQADCKAATTAKRNALLNALNIVIRQDCLSNEDDAAIEGGPITAAQADELERRVALTNSDRAAFLKYAKATSYKDIPSSMYPVLDEFLRKKERRS